MLGVHDSSTRGTGTAVCSSTRANTVSASSNSRSSPASFPQITSVALEGLIPSGTADTGTSGTADTGTSSHTPKLFKESSSEPYSLHSPCPITHTRHHERNGMCVMSCAALSAVVGVGGGGHVSAALPLLGVPASTSRTTGWLSQRANRALKANIVPSRLNLISCRPRTIAPPLPANWRSKPLLTKRPTLKSGRPTSSTMNSNENGTPSFEMKRTVFTPSRSSSWPLAAVILCVLARVVGTGLNFTCGATLGPHT